MNLNRRSKKLCLYSTAKASRYIGHNTCSPCFLYLSLRKISWIPVNASEFATDIEFAYGKLNYIVPLCKPHTSLLIK